MKRKRTIEYLSDYQKNIFLRYENYMKSLLEIQKEYKYHLLEIIYDFVDEEYDSLCTIKDFRYIIKRDLHFYKGKGWTKADHYIMLLEHHSKVHVR